MFSSSIVKNKRKLRGKFVIIFSSSDGIILIGVKPAHRRSAPLIHISIMHAKAKISLQLLFMSYSNNKFYHCTQRR